MRNPRQRFDLIAVACWAGVWILAATALSAAPASVLGPGGQVFELRSGTYGELFPEGSDTTADSPVLALDITLSDGEIERILVPGTESDDSEASATLIYEPAADTVFLLWEGVHNGLHPLLYLTSYDGAEWGERVDLLGSPFAHKSSPQLLITRERADPDALESVTTTIVHLVWSEDAGDHSRKQYAAVVLENGVYLGWTPIIQLGSLVDAAPPLEDDPLMPEALIDTVLLRRGSTDQSVIIGFVPQGVDRFVTLEVEVLPAAIARLSEKARLEIINIGFQGLNKSASSAAARDAVLELAGDLHPSARRHMADRVAALIENEEQELDDGVFVGIAEKARLEIINIGAKISYAGLIRHGSQFVDIEIGGTPAGDGPYHHLVLSLVGDRPAPAEVGEAASVFFSRSGRETTIAWEDDGRVLYVESAGEGWSEARAVELGEGISLDEALAMLAKRTETR